MRSSVWVLEWLSAGLWVSRFMNGQGSISVPVTTAAWKQTGPGLCLLIGLPLGSLPSCPGLLSFLKRGLPTVPQCLPSSMCIFLLPCLLPCQVFEPFLHQSKELASGGSGKGASCGREAAAVFTPCAVDPRVSHTLQLVSQPCREMS